jgi:hydroxypyruvate isomerase
MASGDAASRRRETDGYELSANLEWLFTEAGRRPADRIRAAARQGLRFVEIWTWRDKDLDGIEAALRETGVVLQTMCTEPMGRLVDPATHPAFLAGLEESVRVAERLGCPHLVVTAGDVLPDVPRAAQRAAVVAALQAAAALLRDHDVTLLLENLNSRVDHVGTFLDSTTEVVQVLRAVASPRVALLYDAYHSLVMQERPEAVLDGAADLLAHVQIADAPGRVEPGSGSIDWPRELATLHRLGYRGPLGLEYRPTGRTEDSLQTTRLATYRTLRPLT